MIPAESIQTIQAALPAPERRPGRVKIALAASVAALAGTLLLAASLALTAHVRTRGMLWIETTPPPPAGGALAPQRVRLHLGNSVGALTAYFRRLDYRLIDVRSGADVPRVFASALPRDFDELQSVEQRKSLFLRTVLPLVLRENERLRGERARLLAARARLQAGAALDPDEREWLDDLAQRYGTAPRDWEALLRRVDSIPPSLALAQAATESAWGTSRFVREGNALFGMWTWSEDVPGIVPQERDDDARHRVRAFPTLEESVRAYMRTLNTHRAYREFRDRRAAQRRAHKHLSGLVLASEVSRYSEQREVYTVQLRSLIRGNGLQQLDRTALGGDATDAVVAAAGVLGSPALIAQEPGR